MPQKVRKPHNFSLTAGQGNKLTNDLADIETWLLPHVSMWQSMPADQRQKVLDNSPLLARFMALARQFS